MFYQFQGYPALQGYMAPGYYQQYAYSNPQAAAAGEFTLLLFIIPQEIRHSFVSWDKYSPNFHEIIVYKNHSNDLF